MTYMIYFLSPAHSEHFHNYKPQNLFSNTDIATPLKTPKCCGGCFQYEIFSELPGENLGEKMTVCPLCISPRLFYFCTASVHFLAGKVTNISWSQRSEASLTQLEHSKQNQKSQFGNEARVGMLNQPYLLWEILFYLFLRCYDTRTSCVLNKKKSKR